MAEWSNAAVLKTVEGHTSGGSNPSFSAKTVTFSYGFFVFKIHFKLKTSSKTVSELPPTNTLKFPGSTINTPSLL